MVAGDARIGDLDLRRKLTPDGDRTVARMNGEVLISDANRQRRQIITGLTRGGGAVVGQIQRYFSFPEALHKRYTLLRVVQRIRIA
ncbi:hypothetical protein PDG61_21195 [Mycolicibacterium sp. BiH015]|nr:hypothetical protein [Mycolicibacterium sp. BiH015]